MSRLLEYFNEVDRNAVLRTAHHANPTVSMNEFGLIAEECHAVLSGSGELLAEAVGLERDYASKLQSTHIPESYHLEH
jgi:hypothetical protein